MKNNNSNNYNKNHSTPTNHFNHNYKDTYQIITDYVIDALGKGEIIWKKG